MNYTAEDIMERLRIASHGGPSRTPDLASCQRLVYELRQAVKHRRYRRDFCTDLDSYGCHMLQSASYIMNALLSNQRGRTG